MKLARRFVYWIFVALIVGPIALFIYAVLVPNSGSAVNELASMALLGQALAAFAMLLWCATFLKIEPGLTRAGILLAALGLLLLSLTSGM